MRDQRVVKVLEEENGAVERVERETVGELDLLELRLFGENLVDGGFQQRELEEEFLSQGALRRGFEFCFLRGGDTVSFVSLERGLGGGGRGCTVS